MSVAAQAQQANKKAGKKKKPATMQQIIMNLAKPGLNFSVVQTPPAGAPGGGGVGSLSVKGRVAGGVADDGRDIGANLTVTVTSRPFTDCGNKDEASAGDKS